MPLASFPCAASIAFNFAARSLAASVADKLPLPAAVLSTPVEGTSHLLFLLKMIKINSTNKSYQQIYYDSPVILIIFN